jgi:hypothetical protein
MTLYNLHWPAEALPLQREVADATARVLGPDHPDTLLMQVHVADDQFDLGRFAEAAAIQHHAAESLVPRGRRKPSLCAGHLDRLCHGRLQHRRCARRSRGGKARRRHSRQDSPGNRLAHRHHARHHGMCLAHLHRYAEAVQAVADLEASRGAGFYQTQLAYTTLRDMYAAMGRSADAAA